MTEALFDRIMEYNISDTTLLIYDLEKEAIIGERRINKNDIKSFKGKLRFYLIDKYKKDGFEVFIPIYKNEEFTLLAIKNDRKILLLSVLDSEEERVAWRLLELANSYELLILREGDEQEQEPIKGIGLDSILRNCQELT